MSRKKGVKPQIVAMGGGGFSEEPENPPLDDGVALHFSEDKLVEAVSSRPNAYAYSVVLKNGQTVERIIKPRYLGKNKKQQK